MAAVQESTHIPVMVCLPLSKCFSNPAIVRSSVMIVKLNLPEAITEMSCPIQSSYSFFNCAYRKIFTLYGKIQIPGIQTDA